MNDDLMFDYLVQMGAMRPEQDEVKRKQALVDFLRNRSFDMPQGQMIGKHYVAPSFTQQLATLASGAAAMQGQRDTDQATKTLNDRQRMMLEQLRRRRMQPQGMQVPQTPSYDPYDPYSQFGYGNEA